SSPATSSSPTWTLAARIERCKNGTDAAAPYHKIRHPQRSRRSRAVTARRSRGSAFPLFDFSKFPPQALSTRLDSASGAHSSHATQHFPSVRRGRARPRPFPDRRHLFRAGDAQRLRRSQFAEKNFGRKLLLGGKRGVQGRRDGLFNLRAGKSLA